MEDEMRKRALLCAALAASFTLTSSAHDVGVGQLSDCAVKTRLLSLSERYDSSHSLTKDADPAVLDRRTFSALYTENVAREKVIYGVDAREDAFTVTDEKVVANLAATAALVKLVNIAAGAGGTWKLGGPTLMGRRNVCMGDPSRPDERFALQLTSAYCSGFLVAPDRLVTAGHCVPTAADIKGFKVVFDYRMDNSSKLRVEHPAVDVYAAVELLGRQQDDAGPDWAVLRLDRNVVGRKPVKVRLIDRIGDGNGVYVIGCPAGLPLKYAGRAVVRDNTPSGHFVANLDTYGGNSGSPVFSAATHEVEGILVRGETDFINDPAGCRRSNVCPDTGCRGEDVTRIRQVPVEHYRTR
jgi:hypothetical protein